MKLLLSVLILFLCVPAFPQSLSGTIWALSGVGCRDASLEANTHISKSIASGDITAGIIHFVDGSNLNMNVITGGKERSHSGTYSVSGNTVTVPAGRDLTINIMGERLIIVGSRTESVEAKCCEIRYVEEWEGYKEHVENYPSENNGKTHPDGTWEEQKVWLASNDEEYDALRDKCRLEKPFVYVLGRVN